mgnify:CR=1 FL=1|tara:strand:+ start:709 stop:810 length:102 start_codon:yes stop_codon:yes gene_type:complete
MEVVICLTIFIIGIAVGIYASSQINDDINKRIK